MLKNKILTVVIALVLVAPTISVHKSIDKVGTLMLFPPYSVAFAEGIEQVAENTENVGWEERKRSHQIQQEEQDASTIPYKQPVSKKKMAKKFLMAMGGVAVSSILLFVFLTIYNKIRASILAPKNDQQSGETSLVAPETLSDAVKTFLDKTKY